MLRRPLHIWIIFSTCLLAGVAAMGWISRAALELGRAEADARRKTALEENVRLALWRMDSALAPLIAQECARPAITYQSVSEDAQPVLPPGLAAFSLLRFQIRPNGPLTCPGGTKDGNSPAGGGERQMEEFRRLKDHLTYQSLQAQLNSLEKSAVLPLPVPAAPAASESAPFAPSALRPAVAPALGPAVTSGANSAPANVPASSAAGRMSAKPLENSSPRDAGKMILSPAPASGTVKGRSEVATLDEKKSAAPSVSASVPSNAKDLAGNTRPVGEKKELSALDKEIVLADRSESFPRPDALTAQESILAKQKSLETPAREDSTRVGKTQEEGTRLKTKSFGGSVADTPALPSSRAFVGETIAPFDSPGLSAASVPGALSRSAPEDTAHRGGMPPVAATAPEPSAAPAPSEAKPIAAPKPSMVPPSAVVEGAAPTSQDGAFNQRHVGQDQDKDISIKTDALSLSAPRQQASQLSQALAVQQKELEAQGERNAAEWRMRQLSNAISTEYNQKYFERTKQASPEGMTSSAARETGLRPLWINGSLLMVRRVVCDGEVVLQGCALDWRAIRLFLLSLTSDLLPAASLVPFESLPHDNGARLLAALPLRLEPGALPAAPVSGFQPIHLALIATWLGLGIAALAVGALLAGAVSLSERRGAFVSAVTHELRTPLTTLRMYTEMLSEDRVRGEEKKARYLNTIRIEAGRLAHLVENVLSFARLEKTRPAKRAENLTLPELLDRIRDRLSERAQQAGMELRVEIPREADQCTVRVNPSSVEQILFNLVDNACKYAPGAGDKRIIIEANPRSEADKGRVVIAVRDFGPGVEAREHRRLFQPFHKSARDAANSAPGVGLGLALSRRLARDMHGDLRLAPNSDTAGACFLLTLPLPSAGKYTPAVPKE